MSSSIFSSDGRFVNDGETAVIDSLFGLLLSNPDVGLLDFGKVVVCRNYVNTDTVRIVSGGASGHEPAHAGFVGTGMLTAAIQGDVFCSPTLNDILKTLQELNYKHEGGILVIAQNNTSDRLNFGLAVERARSQAIPVEMLVVSDDCCIVDLHQGKRGSSGIILLNKIAGAMAELGRSLEDIFALCQNVRDNMTSILFSLKPPSSPAAETCICARYMGDNEMEIGAGWHGEPGLKTVEKVKVTDACQMILADMLTENFVLNATTPIVILINNLGTMLDMEELIFVKELVSHFQQLEIPIARVYHGRFLTSLDMKGFSLTILKVFDPKILDYLDAPCDAFAWGKQNTKDIPIGLQTPIASRVVSGKHPKGTALRLQETQANIVLLALQFACDALISCEKQINIIDSESGSGNIGNKMKRGAETILLETRKKTLDYHSPRKFFAALSIISEKIITGTLGFLYGILFEAAANYFRKIPADHDVNCNTWFKCLKKSIAVLESCVKVEFGHCTMYDPLYSCSIAMEEAIKNDVSGLEAFAAGVSAAEETAIQTRKCDKKFPDPGAHVVGIWMRAVYEGIKMRCGD